MGTPAGVWTLLLVCCMGNGRSRSQSVQQPDPKSQVSVEEKGKAGHGSEPAWEISGAGPRSPLASWGAWPWRSHPVRIWEARPTLRAEGSRFLQGAGMKSVPTSCIKPVCAPDPISPCLSLGFYSNDPLSFAVINSNSSISLLLPQSQV